MKKARNGYIKNLHFYWLIGCIALGLMTIVGTGGGDDDTTTEDTLPKTLHVPSEYSTIQRAIDAAREGDTITIAAGAYREQGLEVFGGLTIEGEDAESTIIRGFGNEDVISPPYDSDSTKTIVIKRVTIENGANGIYSSSDILQLTDCIVQNNNSAGIYLYESVATISDCTIANNSGDGIRGGRVTISNSVIKDNTKDGIYGYNATMTNTIIANNTGDGIDCDTLDMSYCTIYGNDDGIWALDSSGTVQNSIIAMNNGYGVFEHGSSLNLSNIDFHGNSVCNWQVEFFCYEASSRYDAIDSILTDPMFVDAAHGDFHLQEGSPALKASDTGEEIGAYGSEGNPPD
jgi:parallel beta-helix repeat protein